MEVACQQEVIDVFNKGYMYLKKSDVGLMVVGCDIVIVVVVFVAIGYLKNIQNKVVNEIDFAEVSASDFAVEIRNLPKVNMPLLEFKGELWQWIENHISQHGDKQYYPDSLKEDEN